MTNGNGKNGVGVIWKSLLGVAGLALTVSLTLLASGRTAGRQAEKLEVLQRDNAVAHAKVDCHEKEIASLKVLAQEINRRLDAQQATLDKILDRLPARNP